MLNKIKNVLKCTYRKLFSKEEKKGPLSRVIEERMKDDSRVKRLSLKDDFGIKINR